jgi:hypothetical protein
MTAVRRGSNDSGYRRASTFTKKTIGRPPVCDLAGRMLPDQERASERRTAVMAWVALSIQSI